MSISLSAPPLNVRLKLHVKYGRVQDDAAGGVLGVFLKRPRLWKCGPVLQATGGSSGLLFLQSYRQGVTVDVIDFGIVPGPLGSPEEGEGVHEAGGPLHRFDCHRAHRTVPRHRTLIHESSLQLPGNGEDDSLSHFQPGVSVLGNVMIKKSHTQLSALTN